MGCAEGQIPSAGSLRVSLRYDFPPFWPGRGTGGWSKKFCNILLEAYQRRKAIPTVGV